MIALFERIAFIFKTSPSTGVQGKQTSSKETGVGRWRHAKWHSEDIQACVELPAGAAACRYPHTIATMAEYHALNIFVAGTTTAMVYAFG